MNKSDRATEARKILSFGLEKAKLDLAVRLYQEGESFGRAADRAHVNHWDLIEHFQRVGQSTIIDYEEQKKEFLAFLKLKE